MYIAVREFVARFDFPAMFRTAYQVARRVGYALFGVFNGTEVGNFTMIIHSYCIWLPRVAAWRDNQDI